MTVKQLIEKLSEYEENKFPVIGRLLHLGGGLGASISKKKIGIIEVDGVIVIFEDESPDPDLSNIENTVITSF